MDTNFFHSVDLPVEALGLYAHARACHVGDAEQFALTVLELRPQNVLAEDVFEWLYQTTQPTPQLFRATFGPEQKCAFCDTATRAQCTHPIAINATCDLPFCENCASTQHKCRIHTGDGSTSRYSAGVIVSIRRNIAALVRSIREEATTNRKPTAVNYCKVTYCGELLRPVYIRHKQALRFAALVKNSGSVKQIEGVPNSALPTGLRSVGTSEGIEIFMEGRS